MAKFDFDKGKYFDKKPTPAQVSTFMSLFGAKEVWEKLETMKKLENMPEGRLKRIAAKAALEKIGDKKDINWEKLNPALENLFCVKQIYVHSLLLESIQHIAQKKLHLVKQSAEALKQADLTLQGEKCRFLTEKLKTPSKEFQEKVQQALASQKSFKLADLDTVYEIAKQEK